MHEVSIAAYLWCWCWWSSQEKQQSQQEKREVPGWLHARAGGGAWAGPVGFQAGGVRHDVCNVVLLFYPVKQVSHWAFGIDGHILSAVRLGIQWDGSLLHVLVIVWAQRITIIPRILPSINIIQKCLRQYAATCFSSTSICCHAVLVFILALAVFHICPNPSFRTKTFIYNSLFALTQRMCTVRDAIRGFKNIRWHQASKKDKIVGFKEQDVSGLEVFPSSNIHRRATTEAATWNVDDCPVLCKERQTALFKCLTCIQCGLGRGEIRGQWKECHKQQFFFCFHRTKDRHQSDRRISWCTTAQITLKGVGRYLL